MRAAARRMSWKYGGGSFAGGIFAALEGGMAVRVLFVFQ